MKTLLVVCFSIILHCMVQAQTQTSGNLTDEQILDIIEKHRPSNGGQIPADLKFRLGVTHVNGQYYFTNEPFIIEGAKKVQELGYGIIKLWFYKADGDAHGYKFNSNWKLSKAMTLKEMAEHKYYKEVFDMPFKVFALNIEFGYGRASTVDQTDTLIQVENEFYELTKYFLTKYKNRDVSFILSNWEGDWMLRGGTSKVSKWRKDSIPSDASVRIKNMIDWVNARQNGVNRAREEIGEVSCKVYNAVEVNKVFDGVWEGMPSITTDVLPRVKVDMVSWSAYDGKSDDGAKMYKGINYLRQYIVPTDYMKGKRIVFVGEINMHENVNNYTRESVQEFCDIIMGVYLAQNIPYVFYWELYSNDVKSGRKDQSRKLTYDEMRGNWLIRPDGSFGWAQEYFDKLLARKQH